MPLAVGQFHRLPLICRCLKASDNTSWDCIIGHSPDIHLSTQFRRPYVAQHVDASALEYAHCLIRPIFPSGLRKIGGRALKLPGGNTNKISCLTALPKGNHFTVCIVYQGKSECYRIVPSQRMGIHYHIRLSGIITCISMCHVLPNNLSFHYFVPPFCLCGFMASYEA